MKRPLSLFSILFIAGILTARASESYFFIAASICVLSVFIYLFHKNLNVPNYLLFGMILFYSIGAFEYQYLNNLNATKYKDFLGKQVLIRGFVDSEADIRSSTVAYVIKTSEIIEKDSKKVVKGRLLLTTLKDEGQYIYDYGSEIQIKGKIVQPTAKRNPGGFDYRRYLAQSDISATVFARQYNIKLGEDSRQSVLVKTGLVLRQRIVEVINKSLPEQQAGLLNGMLIGYRKGLSKEVQDAFSDSGLTHIMAVSGANVAFIVFPLVFVLRKLRIPQRASNVLVIGVLIIFVYITGLEPSVVRAVIMAVTILIGQIMRRDGDIYTSISFAAILMLLHNPNNLFNIGFQLSFVATLSLVMFGKNIKGFIKLMHIPDCVADVVSATLSAQLGVLPLSVLYFNKVSLISLISNLVVIPVLELITILGSIMALLGQINIFISQLIGYVNCVFLSFVLFTVKLSSAVPYAVIQVTTPSAWLAVLYYTIIIFLLWYKPSRKIHIKPVSYVASCTLIILICIIYAVLPKAMEVVFIDVGQGDSILIKTYKGVAVLIDGGGSSGDSGDSSIGNTVIIPLLLDMGVSEVDVVIATHAHNDHIQGLLPVLEAFKVQNVAIPGYEENYNDFKDVISVCKQKNIDVEALKMGDCIKLDDKTHLNVLNPADSMASNKPSLNNTSLVLKLSYKDVQMLLTGDAEKEVEERLISSGIDINAEVLKVAHHGSDTSTGEDFLEVVNPKAVVISVGRNNFGHPSESVVERLKKSGALLFRTDRDGAVIVKTDGRKLWFTKTINNQEVGVWWYGHE
jgi:competence protein ComEC